MEAFCVSGGLGEVGGGVMREDGVVAASGVGWGLESEGIVGCGGPGVEELWATLSACAPCEPPGCSPFTDSKYCSISPMASSNGVSDVLKLSLSSTPPLLNPSWASVFWRSVNEDSSLLITCITGVS